MMDSFQGDFSSLWKLQQRPPQNHLTWDWWWWLVMLDDPKNVEPGKQLMVLWSTKDNEMVQVNDVSWNPKGKPGFDEQGAIRLDGMVCAWWFDGSVMHDEIISHVCDMIVLPADHSSWPSSSKSNRGGGAVVPLLDSDCSMGMVEDRSKFWLNLNLSERSPIQSVQLDLTPWNPAMSTARQANATYAANMGYDILRLHGTKVSGVIDGESVSGTAYFQKVCVQAPSVPWYWGMLHFSDGSYLDWFLPHASLTMLSRDARAWKKRDISHIALSQGGLFHDAQNKRSERFEIVSVKKEKQPNNLPHFDVQLQNGRTTIHISAQAVERAHWDFHQPTRGGVWSHLTYNEYPLIVKTLRIEDEFGVRVKSDYEWLRGNAEHSWGFLH
ncbi:MAG: hypothetical protein ISR25_04425 [Candidatus Poseidoniaceae archaeon]|nr:hypothetical protein [Candidatus Poseidoniaceae archaeon]MBL6889717.1 hypothetical protein [Candidatus Poseidoniaceae archaeon]